MSEEENKLDGLDDPATEEPLAAELLPDNEEAAVEEEAVEEETEKAALYPKPQRGSGYPESRLSEQDKEELFGMGGVAEADDEDDDFSDLLEVSEEDIMGPAPKPRAVRIARTVKPYRPYTPPAGGVSGLRY